MKALENKAIDSKREIDIAEGLDELRTVNARLEHVDTDALIADLQAQSDREASDQFSKKSKLSLDEKEIEDQMVKAAFSIKVKEDDEVAGMLRLTLPKINGNSKKAVKKNPFGIVPKK